MSTIRLLSFNNNFEKIDAKTVYDDHFIEIPMHVQLKGLYPNFDKTNIVDSIINENEDIFLFLNHNKNYNIALAIEHIILYPDLRFQFINKNDKEFVRNYLSKVEDLMNADNENETIYRNINI
jgi:hypothetical protein